MDQKKSLLPSISVLDRQNKIIYILGIVSTIFIVFVTVILFVFSISMPVQDKEQEAVAVAK